MKVSELITELNELPQDANVVFSLLGVVDPKKREENDLCVDVAEVNEIQITTLGETVVLSEVQLDEGDTYLGDYGKVTVADID